MSAGEKQNYEPGWKHPGEMTGVENTREKWSEKNDRVWPGSKNDRVLPGNIFVQKFLVVAILSMMSEVVDEVLILECLESILEVLIEEVAKEEILLRPPGDGDAGQDVR